jgi:tetratricopeptide (TPR) repeat protein
LLESKSGQVVEMLAHIRSLAAQNKLISAMEEAYHALQYAPTYLPLHIQIGELLLKEGHPQDAVDKFLLVAELYTLRGESSQAIRLFDRIIEFAPMDLSVRSRLIELLLSQDKTELAVLQYIKLAGIYYQLAELDNARQSYTSALRIAQQSHGNRAVVLQILYKIADIDMQRIDWRNAMRIFEQIRTLEPEDIHSRACLVDLNYRIGQESAALNEVDGFLSVLENSNKRAKAIEFLTEILTEQPEKANIRKRLAEVYQRDGKNSEAIEQWDVMSNQLLSQGDHAGAAAALQTILTLNPPNAADTLRRIQQLQHSR